MKKHMRWIVLSAALAACSAPPPAALPAMNSPLPATPLPAAIAPAGPTPMNDITPQPSQIDPNLAVPSPTPAAPAREAPTDSPAVRAAQEALARQLNIDPQTVTVISVEEAEWPDGCLGLAPPGQMCTQVIVPGYRVLLDVGGTQYEARTSLDGGQVGIVTP